MEKKYQKPSIETINIVADVIRTSGDSNELPPMPVSEGGWTTK